MKTPGWDSVGGFICCSWPPGFTSFTGVVGDQVIKIVARYVKKFGLHDL